MVAGGGLRGGCRVGFGVGVGLRGGCRVGFGVGWVSRWGWGCGVGFGVGLGLRGGCGVGFGVGVGVGLGGWLAVVVLGCVLRVCFFFHFTLHQTL